jgi:hypothetical protein
LSAGPKPQRKRRVVPDCPALEELPPAVGQLQGWLLTGTRLAALMGSGENARARCGCVGLGISEIELNRLREFVEEICASAEAGRDVISELRPEPPAPALNRNATGEEEPLPRRLERVADRIGAWLRCGAEFHRIFDHCPGAMPEILEEFGREIPIDQALAVETIAIRLREAIEHPHPLKLPKIADTAAGEQAP